MLATLLFLALSAHAAISDIGFMFDNDPPPRAANCETRLRQRRADRLAEFERAFPAEGRAFRERFLWKMVEEEDGRRRLLGVPRKPENDMSIYVMIPLDIEGEADEEHPILFVTIDPRNPKLARYLKAETLKLGSVLSLVYRYTHWEFGVERAAGSLHLVVFSGRGADNSTTLGQMMNFAVTMADLLPLPDTRARIHLVTE